MKCFFLVEVDENLSRFSKRITLVYCQITERGFVYLSGATSFKMKQYRYESTSLNHQLFECNTILPVHSCFINSL